MFLEAKIQLFASCPKQKFYVFTFSVILMEFVFEKNKIGKSNNTKKGQEYQNLSTRKHI